jgi:hypothetical protein
MQVTELAQLRDEVFYEKQVRDELLRDPEAYLLQLEGKWTELAEKLMGVRFKITDPVAHLRTCCDETWWWTSCERLQH